jgi:glycosyltransferase involved in cell wall biosynthesis
VIAKKLFGTKFIFVAYDLYPEISIRTETMKKDGWICRMMRYINKKVYQSVDKIVVLSSEMKDFVLKNRNVTFEKVAVIPNWYKDQTAFDRSLTKNTFHEKYYGKTVVSYFGNMGTCQDMETIQQAMLLLKDNDQICFLFAGHGNKKDSLNKFVKENHLNNVEVYDFLHGQNYQDALKSSTCALISLLDGLTGLCTPSKTYAYMMSGLPLIVIMEDSDIAKDVIQNNAGFVIQNDDVDSLVDTILYFDRNKEKCKIMGKNSREIYLKKYTTKLCTQKYADLFQSILSEK